MKSIGLNGADVRSIYIRSLLFAFGLAAFAAIELLAPRGVEARSAPPVAVGAARAPA